MKSGFSLIMAIFFVMLIATLGMMSLSLSSQTTKQSSDIYLKEQAELYAMSATELAVMAMQTYDYKNDCLKEVKYEFPNGFNATVNIFYLDGAIKGCSGHKYSDPSGFSKKNSGSFDNVAVLDVVVENKDGIEPIRYHRRTVQRP